VYRSTSGKAVFKEISLTNRKWVYLEGITVNGPVRLNGSEHCVVRRCSITAQFGIKAYKPGMMNACIEDNIITGIRKWKPEIMGAGGDNEGEGIQFTGSGNVIRHNRVSGFRDCISHMEDDGAVSQMCNDILNNDISAGLDDGIEADFAHAQLPRDAQSPHELLCRHLLAARTRRAELLPAQCDVQHHPTSPSNCTASARAMSSMHNTVVKAGDGFGIPPASPLITL
jgi:hypothetical protein